MIRKITNAFINWCNDASPAGRFERTIAQGVIGVLLAGITTGEWGGAIIVGIAVAVITPIQAAIGGKATEEGEQNG